MGQSRTLFRLFSSFPHDTIQIQIDWSIDSKQDSNLGGRKEGADESTELCRHPKLYFSTWLSAAQVLTMAVDAYRVKVDFDVTSELDLGLDRFNAKRAIVIFEEQKILPTILK